MGILVDGQWRDEDLPAETGKTGNFQRVDSVFRDRITADGSSGFPAEAGRYHLYVAYTCPWAHRTQIYLALKKLTGAISVSIAVPGLRTQGWTFEDNPAFPDCTPDRVVGTPVVTVRPFNVFGPRRLGAHAILRFVLDALRDKPIEVHGDGSQIRSWCYIQDFCDAIYEMLVRPKRSAKTSISEIL